MASSNPDKTHLKKNREIESLLTEFGRLSLAESRNTNQIVDHTNSDISDISNLLKPNGDNPEELVNYNKNCLKIILNSTVKEIKKVKQNLKFIDQHLYYLNRNIYRSLLKYKANVTPKTSHNAFINMVAFQTFVNDHGHFLAGFEQWSMIVDYVFMAWKHVHHMPIMNSLIHTEARSRCFCILFRLCLLALSKLKNTFGERKTVRCLRELQFLCEKSDDKMTKSIQLLCYEYILNSDFLGNYKL